VIKFSPSGRLLLIGNENGQCFYVYEILPVSGLRTNIAEGLKTTNMSVGIYPFKKRENVKLQYFLFRGYTDARVTDV
jgi:hypothetical protein